MTNRGTRSWLQCACVAALLGGCAGDRAAEVPEDAPPTAIVAPSDPLVGGVLASAEGTWRIAYTVDPAPLPLNDEFGLDVEVRDAATNRLAGEDVELRVDGRMPAHRHGMVRTATVRRVAPGRFRVDGMRFHMLGDWVLLFDVSRAGVVERAATDVVLD